MCTSILCGRKATEDHVVLIARNEDDPCVKRSKYMKFCRKPLYSPKQEEWRMGNGLSVCVPEKTGFSYGSMPDVQGCGTDGYGQAVFEARGINEKNVAVSATNTLQPNDKAMAIDPLVSCGIEESNIVTLLLPQATGARQAAELLGKYVSKYGASEANGVLLADENEVWYFEIGSGHHWIAVRVPDDCYLAVSNCMRVQGVDLEDKKNVICSKGIFEFTCRHGLLKEPRKHKFSFAEAFGDAKKEEDGKTESYGSLDRLWLAQKILTPSKKQKPRKNAYPMFLKPDVPVRLCHVMDVLRAGYRRTVLEKEKDADRPIGVFYTLESHILTLDSSMPKQLKGVIWQTMGSPLYSVYVPYYAMTDEIPMAYAGNHTACFDGHSVYWAWKTLFALSARMRRLDTLEQYQAKWEKMFLESQETMNDMLKQLFKENGQRAIAIAKFYSIGNLSGMAESVIKECRNLLTEFTAFPRYL